MTTTRIQKYGAHGLLGAIGMIVVIESLPDGETKTGQRLRDDLELIAMSLGKNFKVHYKTARSADELESLLDQLYAFVTECGGVAPCLHIECHGSTDGIQLADGSRMPWSRLKPLLTNINLASRMNLILWLACCHGGYFVAECRYSEPVPFACIVGPGNEIDPYKLLAFTSSFYTELFRTRDVTAALTLAGAVRPDISYINFSAVGIFRVALTARIKGAASESRAKIRTIEEPLFDQYRRQFFALDEFPENTERFAITYAEVLAEVEAAGA